MQITVYYKQKDKYLIDKINKMANQKRMSRSAVLLSIVEEYFESNKQLGEILVDMNFLSRKKLSKALELQREKNLQEGREIKLGEILLEKGWVTESQLNRALEVQNSKIRSPEFEENRHSLSYGGW